MEYFISFGLNLVKFRAVAKFSAPWRNRAVKTTGDLSKGHLRIATILLFEYGTRMAQ